MTAPRFGGLETPAEILTRWEKDGNCVVACPECEVFYKAASEGKRPYDIFAPRHTPSEFCRSGSKPHCTCDSCF